MKTFGISTEDDKRIIYSLGNSLLSEYEKLFGTYWWQVFVPPAVQHTCWGKVSPFGSLILSEEQD